MAKKTISSKTSFTAATFCSIFTSNWMRPSRSCRLIIRVPFSANKKHQSWVGKPWTSGYGSRLIRLWIRILAPNTGWIVFTLICCKNCIVCLKRPKMKRKRVVVGPFNKHNSWFNYWSNNLFISVVNDKFTMVFLHLIYHKTKNVYFFCYI